jgi:heme-degrading monooxygenase HmoA
MFSVLFEVLPKASQWDAYLEYAKGLRPSLEHVEGFVDNIRYRSLTREGWILSLSNWRDEKSLVRWRTNALHHAVQERGPDEVLQDYRLRVGQVTYDSSATPPEPLPEQRLDETQAGNGTTATLITTTNFTRSRLDNVVVRCGLLQRQLVNPPRNGRPDALHETLTANPMMNRKGDP